MQKIQKIERPHPQNIVLQKMGVSMDSIIEHLLGDWLQNQLTYNNKTLYYKKVERLFLNDEMLIDDILVYDKEKLERFILKLIDNDCGTLTNIIKESVNDNDIKQFQNTLDMLIKIDNPTIEIKHFDKLE